MIPPVIPAPILRLTTALAAVAIVITITGCQSAPGQPAPTPTPPAGLMNPFFDQDFPDPFILSSGAGYIAYATNGADSNVQTLTSPDMITWTRGGDAMPNLPSWTTAGKVWAPEVAKVGGKYLIYYTTPAPDHSIQCVGVAQADRPLGPFVDHNTKPLVCQSDQGGSIDPSPFKAPDGKRYLYWKNDGNAIGVDTWISVQQLSNDGTHLVGRPKRLFRQTEPWEGKLIEAPFGWEHDGTYYLFYSANDYASADYAVGYATASSPLGPFTKHPEPVLTSDAVASGPGHCALIEKDGNVWMVYHAWPPDEVGSSIPGREPWLSKVTFDGMQVKVAEPQTRPTDRP